MEEIAKGVWLVRGGFPTKVMNVYLIEDGSGVTLFDAGIQAMHKQIGRSAARLGGVKRVVLGHSHADHRGTAAAFSRQEHVPVLCHEDEVADAEGDGGRHYFNMSKLAFAPARVYMPRMLSLWDGGPVQIESTVAEGDEVAGFEVVHIPGHAPGMIALWREADRVALTSDAFYMLDPQTGIKGETRVPLGAFNLDSGQAAQSLLKLAELEPKIALPGHVGPIKGAVGDRLRAAANAAIEMAAADDAH